MIKKAKLITAILFLSLLCFQSVAQKSSIPRNNSENTIGIFIVISPELRPYLSPEDFLALFSSNNSYRLYFIDSRPIDSGTAYVEFENEEPDFLDASYTFTRVEQMSSSDYWIEVLFQSAKKGKTASTINLRFTNLSELMQMILPPISINLSGKTPEEGRRSVFFELEKALTENTNLEASLLGGRSQ